MKKLFRSFYFAFKGLKAVWSERNFKLHIVSVCLVLLSHLLLNYSPIEWIILIICMAMVLAAEIFNTAIEELVNLVSPEKNEKAGKIKDMSAAAVLILSIGSFFVMLLLILNKLKS